MNDEQKTPADDGQEPAEPTPTAEPETVEQSAAEPTPAPAAPPAATEESRTSATPTRTRNILLTSGAGIALASGLIGFGIGHATADDGDGDRFGPMSQYMPGEGQRGFGPGHRPDGPPNGMGNRDKSGDDDDDSGHQQSDGDNDPT